MEYTYIRRMAGVVVCAFALSGCVLDTDTSYTGEIPPPIQPPEPGVRTVDIGGTLPTVDGPDVSRSVLVNGSAASIAGESWSYTVPMQYQSERVVTVEWRVNGTTEVSRDLTVSVAP